MRHSCGNCSRRRVRPTISWSSPTTGILVRRREVGAWRPVLSHGIASPYQYGRWVLPRASSRLRYTTLGFKTRAGAGLGCGDGNGIRRVGMANVGSSTIASQSDSLTAQQDPIYVAGCSVPDPPQKSSVQEGGVCKGGGCSKEGSSHPITSRQLGARLGE